ncbi:MAG: helix-turn-helix transcriptional regulator [Anaerofustis stercorihominis]|nr:helix-turn-helix transcriptional regulator [Anaerofustis stercorihominis]
MNISEKLLTLRKEYGYSQEELAEKLNVSRQAISRWEMGSALPDTLNIIAITKLYGVSADYLLNDEYETEDDMPLVKSTTERATKNSLLQTSYILSLAINAISLLIGFVGYFISKSTAVVLIGIVLSIVGIACFEASLVKYCDSDRNMYRKKFYDISVWLVSFVPVCVFDGYFPVLGLLLEDGITYTAVSYFLGTLVTYIITCLVLMRIVHKKTEK